MIPVCHHWFNLIPLSLHGADAGPCSHQLFPADVQGWEAGTSGDFLSVKLEHSMVSLVHECVLIVCLKVRGKIPPKSLIPTELGPSGELDPGLSQLPPTPQGEPSSAVPQLLYTHQPLKNPEKKKKSKRTITILDDFFSISWGFLIPHKQRYFCPRFFNDWRCVGSSPHHLNQNNCHILQRLF